ncbi:polygalacturonase-like [Heracleum sosnowskyi]|uniref:Polygalacturonase-like n=1 Tax=Heracleum sosnowskyi TaxID=360622 RepID=A0AAD8I5Y4_9APIA|nr:polygalacturonase-like [Heracleum sosnowskyi]
MSSNTPIFLASLIFFIFSQAKAELGSVTFNVVELGAIPDGKTDSSKSFLDAWKAACGSVVPASIYVPPGRFLIQGLYFGDKCKTKNVLFRIDGLLVAPADFFVTGNMANWIDFREVDGVTISGGILDGQGIGLWDCKLAGKSCPSGATTLGFTGSKNIVVKGLTSLNSQMFHIVVNGCQNVKMKGLKVLASGNSPNTDGIHVQLSSGVTILNTKISTGDDCISIGAGTTDLWIEKVFCGPGHGISIGSLGKDLKEPGVENVTVKTVTFSGTQNGARIKTWGRPSSGFARNILFQHITMKNVKNPLVIDQNYCPNKRDCPGQISGVKISDVTYQDIHGTSAADIAVKFDCSKENPCDGIKLEKVKLTYRNQPAEAFCSNAAGTASGIVVPSSCL